MDSVTIGVVGLGGMGGMHAGNAIAHGADVVAGADVVEDARESFEPEYGAETYEAYEAMYDAVDPDAVAITTPNAFHEPAATAALERDIDVLCEKPLADTLEAAESIVEAEAESDAFCMVGFHERYSLVGELFPKHREAGRFGDIRHIEVNYIRRRGIPGVGSWFTSKDLAGGGALIDIGVHAIDFGLYLAGYPDIEEVSGVARTDFGTRENYADPDNMSDQWTTDGVTFDVDDSVNAFIRCANGTTIVLDAAWATNREDSQEVIVRGTEAGARGRIGGEDLEIYETDTTVTDHYLNTAVEGNVDVHGHEAEMIEFLEGVEAGEAPDMNTIEQALEVQRVIDAIYHSSDEGQAVRL
ncbi:MAG: Gfo/Idh/MocA family protein [Halobacteriales archaeon]